MHTKNPKPPPGFASTPMARFHTMPGWFMALALAGSGALVGCQKELMPTPNLYLRQASDPFADVPPTLRVNPVDVLYVTDREPVSTHGLEYSYRRSRSLAFGMVPVELGRQVSWDQLAQASRTQFRVVSLGMRVGMPKETGRWPSTPPQWELNTKGELVDAPEDKAQELAVGELFRRLLEDRLALTAHKDVYLYVHGFNNTFDDSVETIAQVWHFLGRRGVPIAYSWPAGSGGLRGYAYDRESGEFTVFHLKQLLRMLGSCPGLERVHIIAHSRGTDVAMTALRELFLENHADHQRMRQELKLGTLLLAAPDMDLDVALQRLAAERLFLLPETTVVYVSEGDWALRLANWLFLGVTRFGRLNPSKLPREELAALQSSRNIQLIDTYDASVGVLGHNYFYASPAVSSDVILVLRDRCLPGGEHGRPLTTQPDGFWRLEEGYPKREAHPAK